MDSIFKDKVAFVSGAGRGIGREIALRLAKGGCEVLCASKNPASCSKTAEEINAAGGRAEAFPFDVSEPGECRDACAAILKGRPRVDIIVNNAGITRDNLLMRMSDAEWNEVLSTNLSSAFYITRNLVLPMMRNKWGRIINIASISGQEGNAGQANYSAAKAGLVGFTKTLARELAPRNITANAVAPGFIETDMTAALPRGIMETIKGHIPLRRAGQPAEVAGIVAFLASEEAGYITGQVVSVNGGLAM